MKKFTLLKTVLLLCALIVGSVNGWAQTRFNQITNASDLENGDEILVVSTFPSKSIAMLSTVGGSSPKYMTVEEVTINDNSITLPAESSVTVWTIQISGSDYSFKSESNYLICNTTTDANSANVSSTLDDKAKYTLEVSEGLFQFKNKNNTSKYLKGGNSGDRFAHYVSDAGNTRWIKIFKKAPLHNVTFYVNGVSSPVSIYEGADINFPDAPATLGGKVFKGWKKSSGIDGTTDVEPTFVDTATEKMGDSDVNYYAVYATCNITTGWRKYSASLISEEGVYALLTADYHAFNGTISGGQGQITTNAFSFDVNDLATSIPEGICEITLLPVTGGFKMYNSTNGYLYAKAASSGNLSWHAEEDSYWSYTSENWVYNSNSARLRSYNNSYFNTYSNNTGNELVFAKKVNLDNYSAYCTSITKSITVTTVGWATFCSEYPLDFTGTGIKAYTGIDGETKVTLNEIAQVPANTPVVLYKADADGTPVNVPVIASADPVADNDLAVVTDEAGKVGVANMFVLSKPAGKKVGFYPWKVGSTLNKGKVYLQGKAYGSREFLGFDDETTGINAIENGNIEANDAVIYNLNGQRVMNPTKGLYIVNGKKVMFNK